MLRATVTLASLALALAGCSREAPDDPASAPPGAGIPMGAVGAVGASFDAPTARPNPFPRPASKRKHGKPKLGPADPPPPDPFASPPDEPEPMPQPKFGPKSHSPSETTL